MVQLVLQYSKFKIIFDILYNIGYRLITV